MSSLIILPCHSIWKDGPKLGDSREEWYLVDFQIEGYDHLSFKDHIIKSLEYLEEDPNSYLIISGGQTKKESGPIPESLSYYQLALKLTKKIELFDRITTEEFARDSFENVIFSICRYYEVFQKYPESITIIGFEFKRERFLKNHLGQALNFPVNKVRYVGNEPNPKDLNQQGRNEYFKNLEECEYNFAVQFFEQDWYGIRNPLLKKRFTRNPFKRYHGYIQSNPKLSKFLEAIADGSNYTNKEIRDLLDVSWV